MDEAIKLENYSYQDYLDIDQSTSERVELIGGEIFMMAGASAAHQDVVLNIALILKNIVNNDKSKCLPRIAPYDLKLFKDNDKNVVQPDIMLFCENKIPCAVFEVLSNSTAYKDKSVKKELYERFGIKEYFIVDTTLKIIDKYELSGGKYYYVKGFGLEDHMMINCLNQKMNIEEVFENI